MHDEAVAAFERAGAAALVAHAVGQIVVIVLGRGQQGHAGGQHSQGAHADAACG
ncbi:MAG: hypothetical protein HY021_05180 [Burkholderiales bacterium]|nr:hypothetical protein [Burkholderiales bacterium]